MMKCRKSAETSGQRTLGYVQHEVLFAVALLAPVKLGPQRSFRSAEVLGNEFVSLTSAAELWTYSGPARS
eukprot:1235133-Lingulodinium_polyedra.AAC.1